jgi:hypothetical protein
MIGALKSIINCESFGLEESFQGTCFGHVFSKACQYHNRKKSLQKFEICFYQVYTSKFAKMYHLA